MLGISGSQRSQILEEIQGFVDKQCIKLFIILFSIIISSFFLLCWQPTYILGNLFINSKYNLPLYDPKMVKTLFAPEGNGNERNLVVGEVAVVGSSLCWLVPRMSQLTLGVAVAQSETRSSPPSPSSILALLGRLGQTLSRRREVYSRGWKSHQLSRI